MQLKQTPARSGNVRKYLAIAVFLAFQAGAALAGANVNVEIAQQELAPALRQLAIQAGVQIVHAADVVGGKKVKAIRGEMSVEEALNRLLQGSGLEFRRDGNSYVIVAPPHAEQNLGEVVVTATRTERRVDEVPASVSVITSKDIRSQQVHKVEDLLRNIEGVDVKSNAGGGSGMVMMRGMGGSFAGATTQVLVDGMAIEPVVLAPKGAALDFSDPAEIERIEVVRGPAAALYGPSAMGGVINILTKRGSGEARGEVEVGGGTHDARAFRGAFSGGTEKVDFRVFGSDYRTEGFKAEPKAYAWGQRDLSGRDWHQRRGGFSVGIYPSENQEITFGMRQYETDADWLGGRPEYRWDRQGRYYDLGYKLTLGNWGALKLKYLSATIRDHLYWDGLPVNGDPADFTRYMKGQRKEYGDTFEAQINFNLGPSHLLTLGLSHSLGKQVESEDTAVPLSSPAGWDYYAHNDVTTKTQVSGFFAQDEIRLSEKTFVNIGGRYDYFRHYGNTTYDWDNYGTDTRRNDPNSSDGVFNPRIGVRHHLAERTSLYASYGTAYLPSLSGLRYRANAACNSPDLNPEHSASFELGLSREWSSLTTRVALFHTDYKDKIETRRLVGCTQYVNVGTVAVDGVELAAEGRLGSAWRPYANYTYNDSRIEKNPASPASEGKRLNQVARHKLNIGLLYAPSQDMNVRLSGRYVGERYYDGTMTNQAAARAPGYFVTDFKISRRVPLGGLLRDAEISLAINNLFDKSYVEQKGYAAGMGETFRQFGDRRNAWLSLQTRF